MKFCGASKSVETDLLEMIVSYPIEKFYGKRLPVERIIGLLFSALVFERVWPLVYH